MHLSPNDSVGLEQRAYLDLTMRARGGIVIYFLIWLASTIWIDIIQESPLFFYVNTGVFIVIAILRGVHYWLVKTRPNTNTKRMYHCLVVMILLSALHWGVLSAWIIFGGQYQELHYPYMIILAAFAMGGTVALSISRIISVFYPFLIFMPSLILGLAIGGEENLVLVIFAVFSMLYVLETARVSRNDYWKAIYNHKIAADRAKLMEKFSITDQLTQLNNRMYFDKKLSEEWLQCVRFSMPMSILMIDLDHFKLLNDSYGHAAGDECLIRVAKVLKSEIKRVTDSVVRYGGEEFVVILPDSGLSASTVVADRLVCAIAEIKMIWDGQIIPISCSIGIASVVPSITLKREMLLMAADKALYQAKEQGRNRYCISSKPFDN